MSEDKYIRCNFFQSEALAFTIGINPIWYQNHEKTSHDHIVLKMLGRIIKTEFIDSKGQVELLDKLEVSYLDRFFVSFNLCKNTKEEISSKILEGLRMEKDLRVFHDPKQGTNLIEDTTYKVIQTKNGIFI